MERANTDFFLNILFFDDLRVISDYFLTILSILSITVHSLWNGNKMFWNYDVWSILIHLFNSFWFFKIDFWPFYGLFFRYFRCFMSMNELQVTHFDPGIFVFENMIFRTVSRNILWHFDIWPCLGGGLTHENLRRVAFAPGAVLRSSALCLLPVGYDTWQAHRQRQTCRQSLHMQIYLL